MPYVLEEFFFGYHPVTMFDQIDEDIKRFGL
jgi:hypothetical protein